MKNNQQRCIVHVRAAGSCGRRFKHKAGRKLPIRRGTFPGVTGDRARGPRRSCPPYVSRSIKHLQLMTAFHAARQGQTQVVLIEGEAGIGKTRLATEFLAWATTPQADVLRGRALES